MKRLLAFALLLAVSFQTHAATSTWQFEDVQIGNAGTVTGWFTLDDVANTIMDFRLEAVVDFTGGGPVLGGFEPISPRCSAAFRDCAVASVDPVTADITFQRLSSPGGTWWLVLDPEGPLVGDQVRLTPGNQSGFFPFDTANGSYFRHPPYSSGFIPLSGTLLVPEPSTYAMLLAGLGVIGLLIRRRRR